MQNRHFLTQLRRLTMIDFLVLNGPNLNLLGQRETQFYGSASLAEINQGLQEQAASRQIQLSFFQSNSESQLIERIHLAASESIDFLLFNPAGYTHSSVALRDALLATALPFIEIHLSNLAAREPFRHTSYFSDIAVGTLMGFGSHTYSLALIAAHHFVQQNN